MPRLVHVQLHVHASQNNALKQAIKDYLIAKQEQKLPGGYPVICD